MCTISKAPCIAYVNKVEEEKGRIFRGSSKRIRKLQRWIRGLLFVQFSCSRPEPELRKIEDSEPPSGAQKIYLLIEMKLKPKIAEK